MAAASVSRDCDTTPSLIDRLFDNRPLPPWEQVTREREIRIQGRRFHSLSDLKRCIARDLELLLNTRDYSRAELLAGYQESHASVLTYGLPDFSPYSLTNPIERQHVARMIETAIRIHEPRLKRVRIGADEPDVLERTLRFRIDAVMEVAPARESVVFDGTLQLITRRYSIRGCE